MASCTHGPVFGIFSRIYSKERCTMTCSHSFFRYVTGYGFCLLKKTSNGVGRVQSRSNCPWNRIFSYKSIDISRLCLNLIIITLTDFSFRSLSFVFGEPETILFLSASLLESSCSLSIDFSTSLAIGAASRFLKASWKSSPAEPDLYTPSLRRLISSRPPFVAISPSNRSAAVSQAPWGTLLWYMVQIKVTVHQRQLDLICLWVLGVVNLGTSGLNVLLQSDVLHFGRARHGKCWGW